MAKWLLKTEPDDYSFDDLVREKRTTWDGITNALALKHLREMKKGDLVFMYHTGKEKLIVGIAEVASAPRNDERDEKRVVVDIKPKKRLAHPVSLAEIKLDERFKDLPLVRMSRLSVMPVPEKSWRALLKMSERE